MATIDKKLERKARKILKMACKQYSRAIRGPITLQKLETKCNAQYLIQLCDSVLAGNPIAFQHLERLHFV